MKFKVRVFLGDQLIPEDQLKNITINCRYVQNVVNRAVDRNYIIIDDDSDETDSTE